MPSILSVAIAWALMNLKFESLIPISYQSNAVVICIAWESLSLVLAPVCWTALHTHTGQRKQQPNPTCAVQECFKSHCSSREALPSRRMLGRSPALVHEVCWGAGLCCALQKTLWWLGSIPQLVFLCCKAQTFTSSLKSLGNGFSPRGTA